MNTIIQNILAFAVLALAVWFLVSKFMLKPNKKNKGNCGDDCGCH